MKPQSIIRALLLLSAIFAVLAVWVWQSGFSRGLTLEPMTGEVYRMRGDSSVRVDRVVRIKEGDTIRTGDEGQARLRLREGGSTLTLDEKTEVIITEHGDDETEIAFEGGRVRASVIDIGPRLRLTTANGDLNAASADFTAEVNSAALRVSVGRGEVELGGQQLSEGQRITQFSDGTLALEADAAESLLLSVEWPETVAERRVELSGQTAPGAEVVVLNHPEATAVADKSGQYAIVIELERGATEVTIQATDLFGEVKSVSRVIQRLEVPQEIRVDLSFE